MFKALFLAAFLAVSGPGFGPTENMFDRLEQAPSDEEAEGVALDIWAAWMESGSPTVDILMERAEAALSAGDTKLARSFYDRAIRIQPGYAEAYNRRAGLFFADERYDEALRDLNAALEREPRHFGAWLAIGSMLEQLGAHEEAMDAYSEALEIYPRLEAARRGVGRLRALTDGTAL